MGPSVQPDSARLEISALLRPDPHVDVDSFVRALVHGNASTNAATPYAGTGTIFDNGDAQSAYNTFRFLNQAVLEQTFQAGFSSKAYIILPVGKLQASLGYTFEYIRNKDLGGGPVSGMNEINNYLNLGIGYMY
jgi:hypothetical protein